MVKENGSENVQKNLTTSKNFFMVFNYSSAQRWREKRQPAQKTLCRYLNSNNNNGTSREPNEGKNESQHKFLQLYPSVLSFVQTTLNIVEANNRVLGLLLPIPPITPVWCSSGGTKHASPCVKCRKTEKRKITLRSNLHVCRHLNTACIINSDALKHPRVAFDESQYL